MQPPASTSPHLRFQNACKSSRLNCKLLCFAVIRRIELTPAGDALLIHARSVFSVLSRMRDELGEYGKGTRGLVRLSANTSSIVQFLPATLKRFVSLHPHVKIELHEEVSEVTVRMVRDGVFDLGLIASSVVADGLDLVSFHTDRVCMVVRNDHPLAARDTVFFEESLPYDHGSLSICARDKASLPVTARLLLQELLA
jgi:DNA-binding transcriptional LysR family regulator